MHKGYPDLGGRGKNPNFPWTPYVIHVPPTPKKPYKFKIIMNKPIMYQNFKNAFKLRRRKINLKKSNSKIFWEKITQIA